MSCIVEGSGLSKAFTDHVQQYMSSYPTKANFSPLPSSTYTSYTTAVSSQHAGYVTLAPVLQGLQGLIDSSNTDQGSNDKLKQGILSLRNDLSSAMITITTGRSGELGGLPSCGTTGASPKPDCCPTPDAAGGVGSMTDVIPGVYCDSSGCQVLKPLQTGPWNVDGALGGNVVVYEMNNQCQLTVNGCGTSDPSAASCDQFSCNGKTVDLGTCDIELVPNQLGWVPTVTFKEGTCAPATKSPLCSPPS